MAAKRIWSLTLVADSEDLAQANNYLVIDTPTGTKKVPANLLVSSAALNPLLPEDASASNPLATMHNLAPEWSPSTTYSGVSMVTHEGKLYICTTGDEDTTEGTWVEDEWTEVSLVDWVGSVFYSMAVTIFGSLDDLDRRVTALEQR